MTPISKLSGILFLGLLAYLVVSVHSHIHEEASAKYKRDPYKLLARFSQDELGLHSRRRREVVEKQTSLVSSIEHLFLQLKGDNIIDKKILIANLTLQLSKYCYSSNYDHNAYVQTHGECPCPLKYRAINGECNNPRNRLWGKADYPAQRLLKPIYSDGMSKPAVYTKTAREVSKLFVGNERKFDEYNASELVMHMGQFFDHDFALMPHLNVSCNECESSEACLPIFCNEEDKMCDPQKCMKFVRTRPVRQADDTCGQDPLLMGGPRAHPNTITSFVDASNVYGSYLKTARQLRDTSGGRMSTKEGDNPASEEHIHLLPSDLENKECAATFSEKKCGKGGDIRAAEQPVLTSVHTLFVHLHNQIADKLAAFHDKWTDEKLYQESRRILIAIMQKILYGEWLPIVIGSEAMDKFELGLWSDYTGYDESVNPTIFNDFATAFFRFGHSMAPENLKRVTPTYEDTHDDIPLRKSFFNASVTHDLGNGGINSLILGTLEKQCLAIDRHISASIHKHLFEGIDFALDLVALNIQRGRDHGLPGYMKYREHCNLSRPDSFGDLLSFMDDEAVESLKEIYSSVDEIEPFVGMLAEDHLPGALVGPTLACILGIQFKNLKIGDRFWFENPNGPQAFSEEQLDAIRNVTMARVICDNVNVETIQPAVFKLKSEKEGNDIKFYEMINSEAYPNEKGELNSFVNNRVKCTDYTKIPALILDAWNVTEVDLGSDVDFSEH